MPVQMVVDSNFLQKSALRDYFEKSKSFQVVMTDYLWMEIYKTTSNASILKALSIIADYPDQVVLLRGTKAIGSLSGRTSMLTARMVWPNAAADFRELCAFIQSKPSFDDPRLAAFDQHRNAAVTHMEAVRLESIDLTRTFSEIEKSLTSADIGAIRHNKSYNSDLISRILENVFNISRELFRSHPHGVRNPTGRDYLNMFLFRFSLCIFVMIINWIRTGSSPNIKPEKIRNDKVDANFATYATYFSGVLSNDKKLNALHSETRHILTLLGASISMEHRAEVGV